KSPIVDKPDEGWEGPVIRIVGPATPAADLPVSQRVRGWESHAVYVREIEGRPTVVLHGSDPRGTIYAIYTLSQRFLGVQPLWYWARQAPAPQPWVEIPSAFD